MNIIFGEDKSKAYIKKHRILIGILIVLLFVSTSAYGFITNPWNGTIPDIPSEGYANSITNSNRVVVWFFYQKNCPHCHAEAPVIKEILSKRKASVYKIDIRRYPELASKYHIKATPTMIFKYGDEERRVEGYISFEDFSHIIDGMKAGRKLEIQEHGSCSAQQENNVGRCGG